ncbi:hypothetical protein SAMN05216251_114122 [Actinacidiphila alni]|uniref:Uncharacterized protein n=1 Tax=Actinacidiphila alni TaxID=380248 RepID=A0A1I2IVE9_9ACTN|nr:hypothetical protein [Actinacidiphila alni]SFF44491.1 hypothetical protein SAMN05216251_114122 [Actinacidiphila alni]
MPIDPMEPARPAEKEQLPHTEQDVFEDELGAAMRRAGDTFRPGDPRGLVADGHVHGRRLRRRRNAAVTAGVAAFAVIGVGGALIGGLAGGDGSGGTAAAPEKPAVSAGPASGGPSAKPHRPVLTAKQFTDLFVSMLPKGHVAKRPGRGTDGELPPLAEVVFDDGKGPGLVDALVGYGEAAPDCPEQDPPGTSCTTTHVHGGTLTIYKGYEYPDRREDTKEWMATFVTAGGATIDVSEWNAKEEKGAPVSRPNPPLSVSELRRIVTDPRWQRAIDALPVPEGLNAKTAPSTAWATS